MEIIPAINVENFDLVKKMVRQIEAYTSWAQLDISDGTYTGNFTWNNPGDLLSFKTKINFEAHLMVFDIENKINKWLESPVKRVIFHLETAKDPYLLVEKCKKAGKEAGIAISPKTDWSVLAPFCGKADMFQILAVVPGLSGQKFNEECLEKISRLRQNCPNCIIEVDGGVTYEVAKKVAKAGADIVASASAIFNEKNIGEAIEKFKKIQ